MIDSLLLALLPLALQATTQTPPGVDSAARDERTSARELAAEALALIADLPPGELPSGAAPLAVAEALGKVGRVDEAKPLLAKAEAAWRDAGDWDRLVSVAPAKFDFHSINEILQWLSSQEDRELQARLATRAVEQRVKRAEWDSLPEGLSILASQHYPGWNPECDAWLAIGYRALDQSDKATAYERRVLQETVYEGMERDFARAVDALMKDRLRAGDPADAERMLLEFTDSETLPAGFSTAKFELAQGYLELEDFQRAASVIDGIESLLYTALGKAELGVALLAAGQTERGEVAIEQSIALARQAGVQTRTVVAETIGLAGRKGEAAALFDEALEFVKNDTGSSKPMSARLVASAAWRTGHTEQRARAEQDLDEENLRTWVERASYVCIEEQDFEPWGTLLDSIEDPTTHYRALRFASAWRADEDRDPEFAARLGQAIVRRARSLPSPGQRAEILARVVTGGLLREG